MCSHSSLSCRPFLIKFVLFLRKRIKLSISISSCKSNLIALIIIVLFFNKKFNTLLIKVEGLIIMFDKRFVFSFLAATAVTSSLIQMPAYSRMTVADQWAEDECYSGVVRQVRKELTPEIVVLESEMDEKSSTLQYRADRIRQELGRRNMVREQQRADAQECVDSKKWEQKDRLAALESELQTMLAPHNKAIEAERPEFEKRTREFNEKKAQLCREYEKVDAQDVQLNKQYPGTFKRWDAIGFQHHSMLMRAENERIAAVWEELMGEEEARINEIRAAHQKQHEVEIAKLSQEVREAEYQYHDLSRLLAAEILADERETMALISPINRRMWEEIRRPFAAAIEQMLDRAVLAAISRR